MRGKREITLFVRDQPFRSYLESVIGRTAGGTPVYEIAGAAEDPPKPPAPGPDPAKPAPDWEAQAAKWKDVSLKAEQRANEATAELAKLKEASEASKGTLEKIAAKLDASEKRAAEADIKAARAEVAAAKGLTAAQAKRLQGTTVEEFEADADDLIATFKVEQNGGGGGGEGEGGKPAPKPGRPQENLRGGGAPDQTPLEMDPRKLGVMISP